METFGSPKQEVANVNPVTCFLFQNWGKIAFVLGVGVVSGAMNVGHGYQAMLTAGLKQAAYSSVSTVFLLKLYNHLAQRVKTLPGELVPIVVPTVLTVGLNLGVHFLKGTPEPTLSTLPTATMALIGFPLWHIRTRILELGQELSSLEF